MPCSVENVLVPQDHDVVREHAGLKELAGLTQLKTLVLTDTWVTGAGVQELQ